MSNWSAQVSSEYMSRNLSEEEVLAAQVYFNKRNINIISCLKAMVDHVVSAISESSMKSPNSDAALTEITTSNGMSSNNDLGPSDHTFTKSH